MEHQDIFMKISDFSEDIVNVQEKTYNILKGEIIHLIMSKIVNFKQLNDISFIKKIATSVIARKGIKNNTIDIYKEFINPIYNISKLQYIDVIFSNDVTNLYIEKEIILSKKDKFYIYRPDRIVIKKNNFLIVDFKSEYPSIDIREKYYKQVKNYIYICKELFKFNGSGYIIYIIDCIIEKFNIGSSTWEKL